LPPRFAPPPCSRLRNAAAGQGLPQPQPGKWHRPSASPVEFPQGNPIQQDRSLRTDSKRPKGKAAKQRASEQPVFTHLSFVRACMKMWRYLYRNTANKCRENAAASTNPVPPCGTEGLRAQYNKIGYLPYISNPALAGFNHARCGVAFPWPRLREYFWRKSCLNFALTMYRRNVTISWRNVKKITIYAELVLIC